MLLCSEPRVFFNKIDNAHYALRMKSELYSAQSNQSPVNQQLELQRPQRRTTSESVAQRRIQNIRTLYTAFYTVYSNIT